MADVPVFKPTAFYRDPISALRWLEAAFGFETTVLVTDADGQVGYSEMSFGNGAVSINPGFTGDIIGGQRMVSPLDLDGRCTQFIRVHLAEGLEAHCERARAAGARIYDTLQNGTITLGVSATGTLTWAFSRSSAPVTSGVGSASGGGSGGGYRGGGSASAGAAVAGGTSSGGNPVVYVTATGECYHRSGCRYLAASRIPIRLKDAQARGYRPCSVCDPPQ